MADFEIEEEPTIEATFQMDAVNDDHNLLVNRDLPDQHPIGAITGLESALEGKQDILTPGDNIQIEDGVISAIDTTYTAGQGISIEDGVISNTQTSAEWGNITGTLSDQTDLNNALSDLSGGIDSNHQAISNHVSNKNNPHEVTKTQVGLGNVDNTSDLNKPISTATQTALDGKQAKITSTNKLLSDLVDDTNQTHLFVSSTEKSTWNGKQDALSTSQLNAVNSGITSSLVTQIGTNTQAISDETTNRENADIGLQNQIDAIVSSSDVFDIVGTYAELQAYDISTVPVNDIIKVLVDSTHNNAATYYRCVESGGIKSWSYVGSEGAYYTKGEADSTFVPQTRTVNGKALSSNISLTYSDVGADASGAASTAETNAKNYADSLASNYATAAQGTKADTALQPNDNITQLNNNAGYITGISSGDVTTALGYTPVNPSSLATVATSGAYSDLSGTPTIPTVNNATLTITQGGTTKGTFTANASSDVTIALDAGGGGGGSYTAGDGIIIQNDEISVDGVETNVVDLPDEWGQNLQGDIVVNNTYICATYICYSNQKVTSFSAPNATEVSLLNAFYNCKNLISISLPNLINLYINGLSNTFNGCSSLTSINLSSLSIIDGSSSMGSTFNGCSSLTSVEFPELVSIKNPASTAAFNQTFSGCGSLTTVRFPKLNYLEITGSTTTGNNFGNCFNGCSNLTDIYFNGLTTTSFDNANRAFNNMFYSSSMSTSLNCTIHFPSNMETTIQGLAGYPLFGATSGRLTLAYDLPATS